jgi:hypothetical protein
MSYRSLLSTVTLVDINCSWRVPSNSDIDRRAIGYIIGKGKKCQFDFASDNIRNYCKKYKLDFQEVFCYDVEDLLRKYLDVSNNINMITGENRPAIVIYQNVENLSTNQTFSS